MFEKRYKEYVQENEETVREYRERGLLVEVDTGKGMEESWEKLYKIPDLQSATCNKILQE